MEVSPTEKLQEPADPHFLLEQAAFLRGGTFSRIKGTNKTSVLIRSPSL